MTAPADAPPPEEGQVWSYDLRNPTQKGVSIPLDAVAAVANALQQVATILKEHGLVEPPPPATAD